MVKNSHQKSLRTATTAKNSGFSLLEVLISIIILSFGMLGMVGLQAAALQSNREAKTQAVATELGRELADMMRGNNRVSILDTAAANPYLIGDKSSPLAANTPNYCLNTGATCVTALNVADAQMTEWLARVDRELSGARVVVCYDDAPYAATGTPQWTCTPTGAIVPGKAIVLKFGWTKTSTNKSGTIPLDLSTAANSVPSLIFPLTSGSTK